MAVEEAYLLIGHGRLFNERGAHGVGINQHPSASEPLQPK